MKKVLIMLVVFVFMLGGEAFSEAHGLNIVPGADGDNITMTVTTEDGEPCAGCAVEVSDNRENKVLKTGKTDKKGVFSFEFKEAKVLKLAANDGKGHVGARIIKTDKLRERKERMKALGALQKAKSDDRAASNAPRSPHDTRGQAKPAAADDDKDAEGGPKLVMKPGSGAPGAPGPRGTHPVEEAMRRIVHEELSTIAADIDELKSAAKGPGPAEVLGGIGYIIGLFGVWALMKSKKK